MCKILLHACLVLALAYGAALPANGYEARPCADDARLARLPQLLDSGAPIDPPLRLTPETFARLAPEAAARLAPYLRICPDIPLNAQGKPVIKIKMPFHVLIEQIGICAATEDWNGITRLHGWFTAEPLPAKAVPSLLMLPRGNKSDMRDMSRAMGIAPRNGILPYTDIFRAFGGKVSDAEEMLLFASYAYDPELGAAVAASHPRMVQARVSFGLKEFTGSLEAMGFKVLPVSSTYEAAQMRKKLLIKD